jgi:hypothetical protein
LAQLEGNEPLHAGPPSAATVAIVNHAGGSGGDKNVLGPRLRHFLGLFDRLLLRAKRGSTDGPENRSNSVVGRFSLAGIFGRLEKLYA